MATYTKEINRRLAIAEDDERDTVTLVQKAGPAVNDDIVILDGDEAIEVYRFLHRKFGGQ
ncbi:iron(III) dicitrate outer membrane transporter precursor protein [Burkholderia phage AMP1]|uniref:Iron(III) dicitrate outer membrane transporter protein n=4 Tax=Ampunavirus BpAMP1 TaxID=2733589 RepID=A0A5C2IFR9_9CAUD|nr:Iron(III) dicitrate outer membrane transporter precursor protein [Burkholderia phage Bp-AMP1]QEP52844.1 iron(III) dicitrate outer membrane transporter precursor protein [Burkholderia phage AMP1]CDK30089.1 Iron(III) dicitrate outer membrane transporter precursor protein [Burkholderia phage Bp-AMP1]CDL65175.1 Iron(III) dicitrate outer membrane transporter precursor protein FecA [Burkholderia phage Bp-AMP2]CDL65215.1 Iron(III) dicitrate outer membrane transporter precursor protein FecA [Burkhol